jgi:hypothetical protein
VIKHFTMDDIEIDNRDSETTELVLHVNSAGEIRIEVTRKDLEDLLENMNDNAVQDELRPADASDDYS